ncbi:hypothetical protein BJP36_38415 [Moorena producens JHB]|uniref:Uncharacterized protein n=1 Tax=Moorena producens (strain JHB) TaxID=1454205 RepID=A0A9Q9SUM9_MOOP1|nr:hypothetical protein [Moorena producens]WAN69955.1 hypothetical protein BJP36_38415 [Moorena producens JHB]
MLKAYVESKQLSQFRQPVSEIPLTGTPELAQGNASHTTGATRGEFNSPTGSAPMKTP